jgi:hypothetical protein
MNMRRIIILCAIMLLPAWGTTARGIKDTCANQRGKICQGNFGIGICGSVGDENITCKPWLLYLKKATQEVLKRKTSQLPAYEIPNPAMPCKKPANNNNASKDEPCFCLDNGKRTAFTAACKNPSRSCNGSHE